MLMLAATISKPLSKTLFDITKRDMKGKEAGMPVYKLLGGPTRTAVPCYAHAGGNDIEALIEDIIRYNEEGYEVIRCQLGAYGGGGFREAADIPLPKNHLSKDRFFDDELYLETIPEMFANRLFFLEDVLSPEQIDWFRHIRQQCTTPQAMGELFVNPHEYVPLITERLIDYVRVRVSKAGGITPCQKIAHLCEFHGVHTAWQEGGDNDPVNQAAAMHLDMATTGFGIQEENHFSPSELAAFPGHAVLDGGYLYANEEPGLGIDIDEKCAKDLLEIHACNHAAEDRRPDGSIVRP
jgi:mannonate dehydratase